MPQTFFHRLVEVHISQAGVPGILLGTGERPTKIEFKVSKTFSKTPNECEIVITNPPKLDQLLSPSGKTTTRLVKLRGGYKTGLVRDLFVGDVMRMELTRHGVDSGLVITALDGIRAAKQEVNKSLTSGQSNKQVIKDLVSDVVKSLEDIGEYLSEGELDVTDGSELRGQVFSGPFEEIMEGIAKTNKAVFHIEDGKVTIQNPEKTPVSAVLVSEETGFLELTGLSRATGSEKQESEFKTTSQRTELTGIKMLLHGDVKPGVAIQLNLRKPTEVNGTYLCVQCEHAGDNWTGGFYTLAKCVKIGAV